MRVLQPSLLAHLQVEIAFERVVDVDQGFEMRPAQLSPRCGDNLCFRNGFGKAQHVTQVFGFGVADTCGQCAAHHDTAIGEADLFTKLMLLPTCLLDSGGDELGADIALAELIFVHVRALPC